MPREDQRSLPAQDTSVPVVWTVDNIRALPGFGANRQTWFYGLVEDSIEDEQALLIAEIYPGFGYSLVDSTELDEEVWRAILDDFARPLPPSLNATQGVDPSGQEGGPR